MRETGKEEDKSGRLYQSCTVKEQCSGVDFVHEVKDRSRKKESYELGCKLEVKR